MTFNMTLNTLKGTFKDYQSSFEHYKWEYNHFDLGDPDDFFFDDNKAKKRELGGTCCRIYTDLRCLADLVRQFKKVSNIEKEKDSLWALFVEIDDFCDKCLDFVSNVQFHYSWDF